VPNAVTGDCSCPGGAAAQPLRVQADNAGAVFGSTIFMCFAATNSHPVSSALAGSSSHSQVGDYRSAGPAAAAAETPTAAGEGGGGAASTATAVEAAGAAPAANASRARTTVVATTAAPTTNSTTSTTATTTAPVTICPGVTADNTGQADASAALNACVAATGVGGTLALPPGTYLIASAAVDVALSGFTLTTAGVPAGAPGCGAPGATPCATLRAAPGLSSQYGVLSVHNAQGVRVDAVVLDGNRGERAAPEPAGAACASATGNRAVGYTSGVHACDGCAFTRSVAMHAVCGTGLEFTGSNFTVDQARFLLNGDHFGRASISDQHEWSDGLTLDSGPGAVVTNSVFQDGSDINFIIGGGAGARVQGNVVRLVANAAFGGFMLDNFDSPALSNFQGALVTGNTILCNGRCHFGIELGPHPWWVGAGWLGGAVWAALGAGLGWVGGLFKVRE
jgi:hypothetical protein